MKAQVFAATLTPFDFLGRVDLAQLAEHIRWLESHGIQGFAPTGTTGEFLYLNWEERRAIHHTVLEAADKAPVVPCVWDPEPHRAVALAMHAADEGAKAVFLPPPLFHVVDESVILRWYEALVEGCPIPVWAYHHPRTHNPIAPGLFTKLVGLGVRALKDSSGQPARVHALCHDHPGKIWLGGEAMLPRLEMLTGACGHISRLANLYPRFVVRVAGESLGVHANRLLQLERIIKSMGGLPAVKARLGMGCRLPLEGPPDMDLSLLPDPGFPGQALALP